MKQFDHSIHIPHILACPHTVCLSCVNKLRNKKCPICKEPFTKTNLNLALLKFVPESSYDKLKNESIKAYIELNEIKNNLESISQERLTSYESKIASIEEIIRNETEIAIGILKNNEQQLKDDFKTLLNLIKFNLNFSFSEFKKIDASRITIEKDELNEENLTNLNSKISKLKERLNIRSDYIKKYEIKFEFNQREVFSENLSIGELKSVLYIHQF